MLDLRVCERGNTLVRSDRTKKERQSAQHLHYISRVQKSQTKSWRKDRFSVLHSYLCVSFVIMRIVIGVGRCYIIDRKGDTNAQVKPLDPT